ncbi:branched-chain amino acid ABC transporter ATP-binding protein/permease [Parafrankia elaeagni]|uniref:branched-chain amino acid ABC transporter ATP-binding protein/permease n=1 Tax=Parafrankia elaeagni TaxID=222534 RepID=UPI000382BCA5|nr:branched-chain amino acid ABC transporter ATP-binding protein/permease [Parafrankia elaeagni]
MTATTRSTGTDAGVAGSPGTKAADAAEAGSSEAEAMSSPGSAPRTATRTATRTTWWHRLPAPAKDAGFALVVLALAVGVTLPGLAGDGPRLATMQMVGVAFATVLAALGLNLLTGFAKLVSLGQGAFYALGAYASAWLILDGGWPWPVAIIAAVLLSSGVGALVALGSMRLRGPQFAMITLVFAVLTERVLAEWSVFGRLSGYPNPVEHGSGLLDPVSIGGFALEPPLFAGVEGTLLPVLAVVLAVVVVLYRNVARSPWGRSLRALGESEHLAAHLGVNLTARKIAVFTVSAGLGALGGVFYTQAYGHLQPESFGIYLSLTLLLAVILGGGGTVLGPVVGTVILVLLQHGDALDGLVDLQQDLISDRWYLSVPGLVGLLLVVVLYLLPAGLVGTASRVVPALAALAGARRRRDTAEADPRYPADRDAPLPPDGAASRAVESVAAPPRPPAGDEVVLAVNAVSKRFGGLQAVREMSLTVRAGSVHAVIGPNGAGKTTLANLITGVYAPDEGSITLAGRPISGRRVHDVARSGVVRTFQTPMLFPGETVRENVLSGFADTGRMPLWRAALKPPSAYRRETALEHATTALLARVGLVDLADARAGNLSYGRQRALEIARALAGEPRLLVLDEPAAGLNPTEAAELGELLLSLRAQGLAMILVEHHMDLVGQVADEVSCMDQGGLLSAGPVGDVLSDPAVVAAYLGVTEPDPDTTPDSPEHDHAGAPDA